jgi:CDGSH-type Zn-finger protein
MITKMIKKIKPCQCGNTSDSNGNCDGSHLL